MGGCIGKKDQRTLQEHIYFQPSQTKINKQNQPPKSSLPEEPTKTQSSQVKKSQIKKQILTQNSKVSKSKVSQLWSNIRSQGYSHSHHFGIKCSLCNNTNAQQIAICLSCQLFYCSQCTLSELLHTSCRSHTVVISRESPSQQKRRQLRDGDLESLTKEKYGQPLLCQFCLDEHWSGMHEVFQVGKDKAMGCGSCKLKNQKPKSIWAPLISEPGVLDPPQIRLGGSSLFQKLVDLVYSCHLMGVSGLDLWPGNLKEVGGQLYLLESGKEHNGKSDKSDIFLIGELIREEKGEAQLAVLAELLEQDPARRPNSLQLATFLSALRQGA